MIIAVDFDGTLTDRNGNPNSALFARLINEQAHGGQVILWTCRTGESLKEAVMFCASYGLRFNYINENTAETVRRLKCNPRKVLADVYIDDKAVMP